MATLTVTPTSLGSYSCKVAGMTLVALDNYHILHGLGATPHEVHVVVRSTGASLPTNPIIGSYDATMVWVSVAPALIGTGNGQCDVFVRRTHSFVL